MSKDRTLLVRLSTAKQLLENKIDKTERAIKLFDTDSSVYEILKTANLEKCCNFIKTTEDRSSASQELKASLKGLHSQQSVLSKYNTVNCKKFEERSDQIHTIIQARKLLKCIDQHDFKEALKIAGLSDIIKKGAPGITRIWITENTFFKKLNEYLAVKQEEYKIILEAHQAECGASAPALPLSTLLEGSSNCNNTHVANNNHLAADSAPPSVNQPLYPQLSLDITTTYNIMNYTPKPRKPPPPPIPTAPPPPYIAVVADISRSAESDENNQDLLGAVYHHD